jgi:thiol-disulfide isomerase/thioredoxin
MRLSVSLRIATALVLLLVTTGCTSSPTPTAVVKPTATSKPASFPIANDFAFESLDGKTARLSDYSGRIIVLNFWATWCMPCLVEMPALEALHQQYKDRGVVVLAVNVSDTAADVSTYAKKYGLTFPMVRDSKLTGARAYRVGSIPTTVFFDRQGQVHRWSDDSGRMLDRAVGAHDQDFFNRRIQALLGQ